MRKVLMLASVSPMIEGFNQGNIELLQKTGFEVHVMANFHEEDEQNRARNSAFKDKLQEQHVTVFDLPIQRDPLSYSNVNVYRQMKAIIQRENYSLIHCHSPIGGVLGRLAARELKRKDSKVIYTAHGFHFFQGAPAKNWLIYYTIEKLLSYLTDCLITINLEDYHCAQRKHFKMKELEYLNGVGINLDRFHPIKEEEKQALRLRYGFKPDELVLIYVGELSKRKNQLQAIKMMHKLVNRHPQAKLLLVGDGEDDEQCKEVIEQLNLADHVFMLGYRTDIPQLMSLSDLSLSTSRQEGLPVNVMEGMAVGLPIIVTNCRGNRDLIHNGVNGYVVPIDDYQALTEKVSHLIEHQALRRQFGKRNSLLIRPYDKNQVDLQMKRIYDRYAYAELLSSPLIPSLPKAE